MPRPLRLFAALSVACSLAACNTTTDTAYFVEGGPNPAPPPGYRVECTSVPDVTYIAVRSFGTGCRQIIPSQEPPTVLRSRG